MFKEFSVVAVAAALLWATPAKAAELTETNIAMCKMFGSIAKLAMTGRQFRKSPIEVREMAKEALDDGAFEDAAMPIVDQYIAQAYTYFVYIGSDSNPTTRKFKLDEIEEFKNNKEAECLEYHLNK